MPVNGLSVEALAVLRDEAPWMVARSLIRLMRRGLAAPINGRSVEESIAWLEQHYPQPLHLDQTLL
mgnify:CR=1 FL=1